MVRCARAAAAAPRGAGAGLTEREGLWAAVGVMDVHALWEGLTGWLRGEAEVLFVLVLRMESFLSWASWGVVRHRLIFIYIHQAAYLGGF